MGAWGVKALESDEGLDSLSLIKEFSESKEMLTLTEVIHFFREEGMLGESRTDIDFLYDNSAMVIAELFVSFHTEAGWDYDEDGSLSKIKTFAADQTSLRSLLDLLSDIRNEVPDEDDSRELVELWKDSPSYDEWSQHLDMLIIQLEEHARRI